MMKITVRQSRFVLAFATALVAAVPFASAAQSRPAARPAPVWQTQWVPWEIHPRHERAWRNDPRLARFGIPDFPHDYRAVFMNPDTTVPEQARMELMWVRLIAYDAATDRYLGYLLNQPHFIRSVRGGDNVVIRLDATTGFPTADGSSADYAAGGWPADANTETGRMLRVGLGHYRLGNNGHNMPEIERCMDALAPQLEGTAAPGWRPTREQRFIAHFVLGRCLAEKYETDRAVRQFRAAIAIDSSDADAQLALLAELSVLVHYRADSLPAAELKRRDDDFVRQLEIVRRRFASHDGVEQVLTFVFDPAQEAELTPERRAQVERLRRVGYAVFRWKRR